MTLALSMTLDDLIEEFDELGDWESKCEYLMDLGDDLPEITPELKSDRKSTRLNSSHIPLSRMPSSA